MSFYVYVKHFNMDAEWAGLIQAVHPFGALVMGFIWKPNDPAAESFKCPFCCRVS